MRVVIAYDGSPGADVALELARDIAWPAGSVLQLVAVVEPMLAFGTPLVPGAAYIPSPVLDDVAKLYDERVAAGAERLRTRDDVTVESAVRHGRPANALVDEAASTGADLVLAGSRGHGRIASLVLGSVSAEVVDHAPCPVLVARMPHLRRVVLASDGSPAAAAGEQVVATWPIFEGVPIRVVSVAHVPQPWQSGIAATMYRDAVAAHAEDVRRAAAEHGRIAGDVAERLVAAGRQADGSARSGPAADELIAAAEESDADLIVVGSRGQTGITRMVLGSVARNVLNGTTRSVLVVHPPHETA